MINKIKTLFKEQHKSTKHYLVDLHSHLIPGIDDGSKSMEESVELVKAFCSLGFTKLITTPHIMHHKFPNTTEIIQNGLKELQEELQSQNIKIKIEAAAEYYLDAHFMELVRKGDILTFGENYLLFEMSYDTKPLNLDKAIFLMKSMGYQPVLAHPERYLFMHKDFSIYEKLKKNGVYFQVNLNSLGGHYSKEVQKVAKKIVKKGWVDFLGSDTHKDSHIKKFSALFNAKSIEKIYKNNTILNSQLL